MPTPIRDLILLGNRSKDIEEGSTANNNIPIENPPVVSVSHPLPPQQLSNLRSAQTWHVRFFPIKKHMIRGVMMPTARSAIAMFAQRPRTLRLEVRSTNSQKTLLDTDDVLHDDDVILLRVFRPPKRKHKSSSGAASVVSEYDSVAAEDEADDHSLGTGTLPSLGIAAEENEHLGKEHKRFMYGDVKILKEHKNICELKFGSGNDVVVRDIKFETEDEAKSFHCVWQRMARLEQDRTHRQIARYKEEQRKLTSAGLKKKKKKTTTTTTTTTTKGSPSYQNRELPDLEEGNDEELSTIEILIEIVGATNLPIADYGSSDPYVVVRMAGEEVHRTSVISKNTDPIWTLETGSLFLLELSPEAFFAATTGMSFVIKDYDSVGSNEILGNVSVSLDDLLHGTGERTEYTVETDRKLVKAVKKKGAMTKLCLRFKRPSESDKQFMQAFKSNQNKLGLYVDETFMPVRAPFSKMLRGQRKTGAKGETLYRVKPFPDPTRENETKWMSEQQIETESVKPSTYWVESGSGDHGKVYFEIIGCDGLPNMDSATLNLRDKTDAFACIMFEDCIVNTDVITDSLSPRWPPWCRRAFVFNIAHPTSDILLALFDHDPELSPAQLLTRTTFDLHDPIGRIRVNLSKFAPDTSYDLFLPLYFGELEEHRKEARGNVHIRLRIEFSNVRKAMISALLPQPSNYVSVANKIDFAIAHYTADGVVDERKFSMALFTDYIQELESYQILLEHLSEAALVVWLWRGHYEVHIAGKKLMLPLHSLFAYVWAILVTWNFNLFPSFLLFAVGWTLLATNEFVKQNPSHWKSSRGYFGLLRLFVINAIPPETVPANHRIKEIEEFNKKEKMAVERRKRRKELEEKQEQEILAEMQDEIEQAGEEEVDIASGRTGLLPGMSVNPLKPILYPIQKELRKIVRMLRIARTVVLWEETYLSFWIVTFAFLASAFLLFVPWAFLLRWALRIAAWLLLGPWMILVDKYYFKKILKLFEDDSDETIRNRIKARYTDILESALNSRIRTERALKLKSMKRFCFGKYLINVPIFNEDLYWDSPLPQSSAMPCKKPDPVNIVEKKYGQNLSGDMIPQREMQMDEKENRPEKKKPFWKRKLFRRKKGQDVTKVSETSPLLPEGSMEYHAIGEDSRGHDEVASSIQPIVK